MEKEVTSVSLGNLLKLRKEVEERLTYLRKLRRTSLTKLIPIETAGITSEESFLAQIAETIKQGDVKFQNLTKDIIYLTECYSKLSVLITVGNSTSYTTTNQAINTSSSVSAALSLLGGYRRELSDLEEFRYIQTYKLKNDRPSWFTEQESGYEVVTFDVAAIESLRKDLKTQIQTLQNHIDEGNLKIQMAVPFYEDLQAKL